METGSSEKDCPLNAQEINELNASIAAEPVDEVHPLDRSLEMSWQPDGGLLAQVNPEYQDMTAAYAGVTTAQMLRAVLQHPDRLGEPIALTANFVQSLEPGEVQILVTPLSANGVTQHWTVSMRRLETKGVMQVVAFATIITGMRHDTFSHDELSIPAMPDPQLCERWVPSDAVEWLKRYDMRLAKGALPSDWDDAEQESISQLWVRDDPVRALDFPALAALNDVFFPRIWLRRARKVPVRTVAITIYFHAHSLQLTRQGSGYVLAQASAQVFRNGFFDQNTQLWDNQGHLLATSHHIVCFKE